MIVKAFEEVAAFFRQLAKEYGVYVFVHDFEGFIINYYNIFPIVYMPIQNTYCDMIFSKEEPSERCRKHQYKLFEYCKQHQQPFWGMCYAGVEELVVPMVYNEKTLGYISIGGFRLDREKALPRIKAAAKEYDYSINLLLENYNRSLKSDTKGMDKVEIGVRMAACTLALIYRDISMNRDETERILIHRDALSQHIKNYIGSHYMTEVSNKLLAGAFGCSISYITHTFKKDCGMSVKAYLNLCRTKRARELLENSKAPISNIALSVGFMDANYFSKVFKQFYGMTPSECRKMAAFDKKTNNGVKE